MVGRIGGAAGLVRPGCASGMDAVTHYRLPDVGRPADWQVELDTYDPHRTTAVTAGDPVAVGPRSLTVLRGPR